MPSVLGNMPIIVGFAYYIVQKHLYASTIICATMNGMERDELKEYAQSLLNELSTRELEAVVGILQCMTGRDESDTLQETASGEGLPPADLFNKFFS
jgi:hypothetical protein